MLTYFDSTDRAGRRRQVLTVFDKTIWEKGVIDMKTIKSSRGFDLSWTCLNLIEGWNAQMGIPKIRTIQMGTRLVGKKDFHEHEVANKRRSVSVLGKTYEIREYTRLTYYSRLYKWFGWVVERKHVYQALGEACPKFTFRLPAWDDQTPSDFEIIHQAKELKRLVDDI